jgi:hypothetical protein
MRASAASTGLAHWGASAQLCSPACLPMQSQHLRVRRPHSGRAFHCNRCYFCARRSVALFNLSAVTPLGLSDVYFVSSWVLDSSWPHLDLIYCITLLIIFKSHQYQPSNVWTYTCLTPCVSIAIPDYVRRPCPVVSYVQYISYQPLYRLPHVRIRRCRLWRRQVCTAVERLAKPQSFRVYN